MVNVFQKKKKEKEKQRVKKYVLYLLINNSNRDIQMICLEFCIQGCAANDSQ